MWGGTFHSVGNRVLRRHGRALGLDPDFTVLDQTDAADLLALVRSELHAHDGVESGDRRRAKKDTMAAILSRVINTSTPAVEGAARHVPVVCRGAVGAEGDVRGVHGPQAIDRRARLRRSAFVLVALVRSPAAAPLLEQFDHVLIDEYQDTNALQGEIVAAMAEGGATITAVGDDAQAIYGFRNATPRNILDFPSDSARSSSCSIAITDPLPRSSPPPTR